MDATAALDGVREALRMTMLLGGPVLLVALAVGVVVGLLQTMTQLQEPTVALVPRLLVVGVALLLALPWLFGTWVAYAGEVWGSIPTWVGS
jgi:flagellar biosynthesis protein FliQ